MTCKEFTPQGHVGAWWLSKHVGRFGNVQAPHMPGAVRP